MAKSTGAESPNTVAEMFQLDLKNRSLAALLAWLVPGAGHLYQGRNAKGLLLMLCICSTFVYGLLLGSGKVAFASPTLFSAAGPLDPGDAGRGLPGGFSVSLDEAPFFGQCGVGVAALAMVIERQRFLNGSGPLFGGVFYPPRRSRPDGGPFTSADTAGKTVTHPSELAKWRYDIKFDFEVGTLYTVIAGLLNILAVYDAHSGPLIPRPAEEKETPGRADDNTDTTN